MRGTLLGAMTLALALPGCSAGSPDAAGVPTATPPARSGATAELGGAPPPPGALDGKRQVFFLPRLDDTELPDSVLAVTAAGRVQVTDDYAERALFVPVPKARGAKERLIKTGALRAGGEPFCLQVRGQGPGPLTVVTAACDAGEPAQLFTFEAVGEDGEGRMTYLVRNRDAVLQWHPMGESGLLAEKLGDSPMRTTFSLQDQGAAALPAAG
ncbi:hypothetical protein GCM10020358_16180 [Amorphoplanes nipponensis]|uniref:Lipoprotein n=1 Tax=Actinoplanes nipponensis TaxID=135950 RepID=A0A919JP80_9ACTN|nr:hypothetical protein [Actinoplanes nipponensis]GIE52922.1 hypothetical protein Ani05nite_64560 [Actinoplanes nipponensis]